MTDPIEVLRGRGFLQAVTDEDALRRLFAAGRVTYYVGFDPTGPSLHIGHLKGMMAMAWLQRLGHRPIALSGGGTGRIGDPSFRDDERELLDEERLSRNLDGIRTQLSRVLDLQDGLLLDNYEWLGSFGFIEFMRDVGKHFSVNAMIARESVRRRLEEREHGISFTEFSYQLLQAYDFAHLYAAHGCRLQGGGSDQWGNITAGIDLTRRLHGGEVYGLVWPLVERSDGRKFSKSTGEAVWLDAELTSPYAFYQWFLNVPDEDAVGLPEDVLLPAAGGRRPPSRRSSGGTPPPATCSARWPPRSPASSTGKPGCRQPSAPPRCSSATSLSPASTIARSPTPSSRRPRWTSPGLASRPASPWGTCSSSAGRPARGVRPAAWWNRAG